MSPAPARLSHPGGADCAAHEVRIDSLDDQVASLRRDSRESRDGFAELRTEVALSRQATETLTRAIEALDRRLAAMEAARAAETQQKLDRSAMPSRADLWRAGLAALVGLAVLAAGWVGGRVTAPGQGVRAQTSQQSPG